MKKKNFFDHPLKLIDLYNNIKFKMGSIITVNKHRTDIDDWLSIHEKLHEVNFNSEIHNHLSVWKVAF